MKSKILLLAFSVALLTSCTTAYKTGQTPDDVYYSPVRPENETVKNTEKKEDRTERKNERNYDESYSYSEDYYLRMKVRDRYRWNEIDDPYYYSRRYNTVSYNCCCFGNPWTPSTYWNSHYNPYYQNTVIVNPKSTATYTAPRTFNLNSYNNNALTNNNYTNPKTTNTKSSNPRNNNTYTAPRNETPRRDDNSGNILREIFNSGSNSGTKTNSSSSGNNNNSSSSSPSSSSSSSGSTPAPVRKF